MATLKASQQGITAIKQARIAQGWSVDDFRWLESASEILGVSWQENGVLAVGISEGTWKRFLAGKNPINADAFKAYCQVLGLNWQEVGEIAVKKEFSSSHPLPLSPLIDWGDAPDVSFFYGRQAEIQIVKQWVVQEKCRLITLLGMGGIGKTTLCVKVAQQIVEMQDFACLIWRSLRNAPPIEDILVELIQVFSKQQETVLPVTLSGQISLLLKYLRSSPCLLILDNAESILQPGERTGSYQVGYEGYSELFRCFAETFHQSCLILTSREKPQGLAKYEGESLPVRSLQLTGLAETEGRELFGLQGKFKASEVQWQALISRYGGNPLALKIVASSIHDFFDGDVCQFLEISLQSTFIFDDIRDLLDQQFYRLTKLEQQIMFWVAINREPVSLSELQTDFVINVSPRELLESLSSLQRRSFIQQSKDAKFRVSTVFTQQPVVMEYVINQIIEKICDEIVNQKIYLFASHALMKAQAKDYVRETQINLILQPIINQLTNQLGSSENIYCYLNQILSSFRGKSAKETGYLAGNSLNLLHQAQVDISDCDFSGLTLWQAYLQGVHLHDVNFSNSDLSRCVFTEILGNILSANFSSNGKLLATCDTDCNVRIWEVKTGKLLLICQGHNNWVRFVTFSPNGDILASCGADHQIKLWNVRDGICIKTLTGHDHEIFSLAFSPKGNILASASGDRTIKIWDIYDGNCIKTLTGHTDWVRCVTFSPQGEILASSGADHKIKLWDLETGECVQTLSEHQNWVRSIAFSPDNQTLASASGDRTIKIWNYQTGECLKTYSGHTNSVYSVAFSPGGEILVSGSGDRSVKIWDCKTHTCIKTLHKQTNEVCCVAVSPDNQTIACVSLDQTMRLWDYHSGECLKTWQGNTDWALPVKYSPNNQILASGSNDKTIKLWDWQTGNCLRSLQGHSDFIYGLAFNPEGQILASASTDSTVRLWAVNTGKCFQILQGHTDWVYAVEFHPNGEIIASASADCTIKIWDWHTGQSFNTLTGHTDKILGITFSHDGKILASASADQTVRIWDWQTGNCLKILSAHADRIYAVIFSQDDRILATCSTDQTIKLWQFPTGEFLKTLTGHKNWVFSIAFSPDINTLASASHDQTVRIWDVKTGECKYICVGHTHLVSAITFSPGGKFIASGSQDQTVRIWDINTGESTRILIAKRLYEGMRITGVKGLTDATILTLQALGAVV
ncbi:pentapeptide repeat-containing protein [Plectonema cf. radiosum LEGE 06105]|uniref:Pentapeptide repeat-containing protein n=1 Tax=Plectonema cf. radiosum LEGE 06105 TaxID=945769 RepID=A0A8J7JVK6_9CYAN|nr:NB-ARC domain-containing protein [Plectonema radiosum]MBE9214690.1 pentapeptide repeat-containing protein [Plectonema cf. radiosum LEGE 06105]